MKFELHVPTVQFGFILAHMEADSPQEIIEAYRGILRAWEGGAGISDKEMNAVVDSMLRGEPIKGGIELWERMSPEQQNIAQAIKRGNKRVLAALNKS